MGELEDYFKSHSADDKSVGFDYQFYYFVAVLLDLKQGEKVGFEVKDDIHIENRDGTTILFQAKHTVLTNSKGEPANLTTLDIDLWKTLGNWVDLIKIDKAVLENYQFVLVTNKGEGNNKFINALSQFHTDNQLSQIESLIKQIESDTNDKIIEDYISKVMSLKKKEMSLFLSKLSIKTELDDIIALVKVRILETTKNDDLVDPVYESLIANLLEAKYLDVKDRSKFEITFDDFKNRFGKCFRIAFKDKPLPKRYIEGQFPDNLEEQLFIKQLIDIEDIESGSPLIIDYTTQMLRTLNLLSYWFENNFVLPLEMEEFNREAMFKWGIEHRNQYRQIERSIKAGEDLASLEPQIKELAQDLVYKLRKEDLNIAGDKFGVEFSNGHYYALSDKPEIGWHYEWEERYKDISK
jgi:hypothetical protein